MIKTAITKIALVGFLPLICSLAPVLDPIAFAETLPTATTRIAQKVSQNDLNASIKLVERANSLREQNQLDRALTLYRQAIAAKTSIS